MQRKKIHQNIFQYGTILLAAAIPFSNKLSTWCIILLMLNWIAEGDIKTKITKAYQYKIVIICSLFYLLQLASLFFTHHFHDGFYNVQTLAPWLVIPLLYFSYDFSAALRKNVLTIFTLSVLLSSLYCFCIGFYNYYHTGISAYLFYHTLVAPINQHAVYFSLYVLLTIAFVAHILLTTPLLRFKIFSGILLLVYFIILLVFLRSKLVLCLFLVYALARLIYAILQHRAKIFLLAFLACLIFSTMAMVSTSNPVSRQFYQLKNNNWQVLAVKNFDPGDHFNEVQLRLVLWKFSVHILSSSHHWIFGVTPGDAQHKLNQQMIAHNMYTGIPGTDEIGYLKYNVHNQYLETLLRSGLAGLLLLVGLLFLLFKKALQRKDIIFLVMLISFACVFFTESVLQRQFGVVPFFFFSSIFILAGSKKESGQLRLKEIKNDIGK